MSRTGRKNLLWSASTTVAATYAASGLLKVIHERHDGVALFVKYTRGNGDASIQIQIEGSFEATEGQEPSASDNWYILQETGRDAEPPTTGVTTVFSSSALSFTHPGAASSTTYFTVYVPVVARYIRLNVKANAVGATPPTVEIYGLSHQA